MGTITKLETPVAVMMNPNPGLTLLNYGSDQCRGRHPSNLEHGDAGTGLEALFCTESGAVISFADRCPFIFDWRNSTGNGTNSNDPGVSTGNHWIYWHLPLRSEHSLRRATGLIDVEAFISIGEGYAGGDVPININGTISEIWRASAFADQEFGW